MNGIWSFYILINNKQTLRINFSIGFLDLKGLGVTKRERVSKPNEMKSF